MHEILVLMPHVPLFTAGADYKHSETTLSFNESMTQHSVQVPIFQDNISEGTEQFCAKLTLQNNSGITVIVDPAVASVIIIDGIGEL